jgi:hypothetical protein
MVALPKNLNATKIDLSGLGIKEIPQEVFKYKNLRKLFLQDNLITKIPAEIKRLKLLCTLDVSNNSVTSLYASVFELNNLKVLIVNDNKIKNIPPQIKKLNKLKILGIANNQLVSLNSNFEFLKELKELNLSGNKFQVFPDQIYTLRKLEKLWIKQKGLEVMDLETLKMIIPIKKIYTLKNSENLNKIPQNIIKEENTEKFNQQNTTLSESRKIKLDKTETKTEKEISMQPKKKIFISYSHQDLEKDNWLEKVKKHLKVLSMHSELDFEVWDDKRINAGDKWREEIKKALSESTAAILLISTNFLASEFIQKEELQPLLKRAGEEGTVILSLLIKPSRFTKIKSLSDFQAINNPETEILSKLNESEQDDILLRLTDAVEIHINK